MNKFINYVVVQNSITGADAIKLLDDPYTGIIFSYGKVRVDVDQDNDTVYIDFDYEIVDFAGKEIDDYDHLEKIIGLLLERLLHDATQQPNLTH